MPIEFINADLEIFSNEDLEPIRKAFENYGCGFSDMYCGKLETDDYLASFEIHPDDEQCNFSAETLINAFCDSIFGLEGLPRDLWERATKRIIDLGYQSDNNCIAFNDHLSANILARIAKLGIDIHLTIYPQILQNKETK